MDRNGSAFDLKFTYKVSEEATGKQESYPLS